VPVTAKLTYHPSWFMKWSTILVPLASLGACAAAVTLFTGFWLIVVLQISTAASMLPNATYWRRRAEFFEHCSERLVEHQVENALAAANPELLAIRGDKR
jgi:hypothetical protein